MPFHFEIADVLHVEPFAFEPHAVTPTILDGGVPVAAFETRISSRFLTRFEAAKERLKRLVQLAQGLLARRVIQSGHIAILGTQRFELVRLVVVVERDATLAICLAAFFERSIVELMMQVEDALQRKTLGSVWIEAVLEVAIHRLGTPLLGFDIMLDGLFRGLTDTANVIRATP